MLNKKAIMVPISAKNPRGMTGHGSWSVRKNKAAIKAGCRRGGPGTRGKV
jgi:hypothetical protein